MTDSPSPAPLDHPLAWLAGQIQQQQRQNHSSQERDRAPEMQLPGSKVGWVSMGSGCAFAAGAGSVRGSSSAVREAQQEGLQRNLSVATGRTQLQNATRTYLVWVSFRQAAFPGKNAHGAQREQLELHSMVWTGTDRGRQLLRAQPSTSDGSRSQHCSHRKTTKQVGTG